MSPQHELSGVARPPHREGVEGDAPATGSQRRSQGHTAWADACPLCWLVADAALPPPALHNKRIGHDAAFPSRLSAAGPRMAIWPAGAAQPPRSLHGGPGCRGAVSGPAAVPGRDGPGLVGTEGEGQGPRGHSGVGRGRHWQDQHEPQAAGRTDDNGARAGCPSPKLALSQHCSPYLCWL